jgi:NADPH:quinone reductase-like Zn-dependent oxidoreductase/NADP-dependent 3-hydroxy acid dehydrogenase YdfG/acyl carrier protein
MEWDGGVAQAPLWGFGRVVANEEPGLHCSLVDLAPTATVADAELLAARLCADSAEDQLALRDGAWYAARLVHAPVHSAADDVSGSVDVPLESEEAFALAVRNPGALDALHLHRAVRRPPARGEIEIEVSAAGLNFLDVLKALGDCPGLQPGAPVALGGECAGRVVALGSDVHELAVGDRVVAITPSFARVGLASAYVTIPAQLAARAPAALDDSQAATLPLVFITALYALRELGRIRPGERVLIHAAAGGVGLAALQLVRHAGAEPLATAGSAAKRDYLRGLGVRHVFDSRSLDFARGVMAATDGRGVDVVLNSLAGEFVPAGLGVLAPRGRFLEIGKRDIYADRRIGLEPFKRNLAFHGIDVAALVEEDPSFVGGLLREVIRLMDEGVLSPLPVQVRPIAEAEDAFRTMAQARHIGKLALDLRVRPATVRLGSGPARVRPDATYVITGGLGALGLQAAGWLVDQGARHLLLLGRRAASPAATQQIDEWRARGVTVTVEAVDVADRVQLARALAAQRSRGPRLAGAIHAAGVLADATVAQLDTAGMHAALAPKVLGAWHLHTLTHADALDFLVLYSSAAGLLGLPGQANYAGANSFLDALAWARRAHGQSALSINWGPWADVGLAAASEQRGARLASRGLESLAPADGLAALGALLAEPDVTQRAVMPFDSGAWAEATPAARSAPMFDVLREAAPSTDGPWSETARPTLVAQLRAAAPGQPRRELMHVFVRDQLARVLGLDAARISAGQPLQVLGLDSLLALEFRNRLEAALGLSLPATLAWNYPTLASLVPHLASTLGLPLTAEAAAPGPDALTPESEATADAEAALADFSDAELAELLAGELQEVQNVLGSAYR